MKSYVSVCSALLLLLSSSFALSAFAADLPADLYVDPVNGKDSNTGSSSSPFQTIAHARDVVRAGQRPPSGLTIHLLPGTHSVVSGTLQLNASDSGTPEGPITYLGQPGAVVSAGVALSASLWRTAPRGSHPLIRADGVVSYNLSAAGITNLGQIHANPGLGSCPSSSTGANGRLEVFVDDAALVLARYPNINNSSGLWQWENIDAVKNVNTTFTYSIDRPSNWVNESTGWLWGYWSFGWADSIVKLDSIDVPTKTFNIDPNTPPTYGFKAKARWLAFNLMSELDAPGEYFVDNTTGTLYMIPPAGVNLRDAEVIVSVGGDAVSLDGVSNVKMAGFKVGYTRGNGIEMSACNNITASNVTVVGAGGQGISMQGANIHAIGLSVSQTGCKGVTLSGGDTTTLTPGGNALVNSTITQFSRHTRTYNPGLSWGGVGNLYQGNAISDAPHAAILGGGNDCIHEHNQINHVGFEVDDSGAFYSGRNWNARGNVIRFNTFQDIRTEEPVFLGSPSVQAIYLDDELSGYEIYNNTFVNCHVGIFVGGGRRNHIKFNLIKSSDTSALHLDSRGLSWQTEYCTPGGHFQQGLESFNYQEPPYAYRYPYLSNIMHEMPCYPVYNEWVNNVICDCKEEIDFSKTKIMEWRNVYSDNTVLPSGCNPAPPGVAPFAPLPPVAPSVSPSGQVTDPMEADNWWVRPADYVPWHQRK